MERKDRANPDQEDKEESGSIELIVLGLLAALIVVLCIPVLTNLGVTTRGALNYADYSIDETVPDWAKQDP